MFQHTAARRRLVAARHGEMKTAVVSTHSRPKAAGNIKSAGKYESYVSTHSRPKAAGFTPDNTFSEYGVSTHSRPKAAGCGYGFRLTTFNGFNTQPPEGGWFCAACRPFHLTTFQHTAARRRLGRLRDTAMIDNRVSTHSRPKAAGKGKRKALKIMLSFQHTAARRRLAFEPLSTSILRRFQHTAARRRLDRKDTTLKQEFGFNTQPPEGGWRTRGFCVSCQVCFNTQPPEGGWKGKKVIQKVYSMFQHTAARRRLVLRGEGRKPTIHVSTHSRPKAAGATVGRA